MLNGQDGNGHASYCSRIPNVGCQPNNYVSRRRRLVIPGSILTVHLLGLIDLVWRCPSAFSSDGPANMLTIISIISSLVLWLCLVFVAQPGIWKPSPRQALLLPSAFSSSTGLRFCEPCGQDQPLRCKHCSVCDHCVLTFDHHCIWLGTCIGEGNRWLFSWYLFAQSLEGFCCLHVMAIHFDLYGVTECLYGVTECPELLLFCGLLSTCIVFTVFTAFLSFSQALVNITTWEILRWNRISYLRNLRPNAGSPFCRGYFANLSSFLCPPLVVSWFPVSWQAVRFDYACGIYQWKILHRPP